MSRHVLIFEPTVEGHVREWLGHLIAFAAAQSDLEASFLVAPEFEAVLESTIPRHARGQVHILALKAEEVRAATRPSLILSGFARHRLMRRYLDRLDADAGHFLALDHLSLCLALGLGFGRRKISGVLFRPSVHYGTFGPYRPRLAEWLRDLRKDLLYRLMLFNPAIQSILSLDPYFPAYAHQRYAHAQKITALADPVHPTAFLDRHGATGSAIQRRRRFLLFGALTRRKGVMALFQALSLLPPRIASRSHITIAGRIAPDLAEAFGPALNALNRAQPSLKVTVENRWIMDEELDNLTTQADVILAPYQRYVGSSGVLLWAAAAAKPVLTQNYGLIGRLVREHGLGLAVDTEDPGHLAAGIQRFVDGKPYDHMNWRAATDFLASHDVQAFAKAVFSSLVPRLAIQSTQPAPPKLTPA